MAPAWTELAEHYVNDDGITIAKMDGTQNEVEGFEIKGFVAPCVQQRSSATALLTWWRFVNAARRRLPLTFSSADTAK